jgi:hypothetical protein
MDYMDDDMRELMGLMSKAVVPREKRRAVVRTNRHAPYYSKSRYRVI